MRMMLRGVGIAMVAACALSSAAHAQVFYSFPGAKPVTDASPSLGLVAGFGDNTVRLGGFGRFNLSSNADLGLEAMFQNVKAEGTDNDTAFGGGGADGKYQFFHARQDMQIDIAANVGVGVLAKSGFYDVHVPFGALVSHDFNLNDGHLLLPYAGLYFVYDYEHVDVPAPADNSNSDFDTELRIGVSYDVVKKGSLFAALHAGNGTMFFIGFNAGL
jgi:hypothetical protein